MSDPGPSAPAFFGGMVDSYDSLIRRAVPRYDEMVTRVIEHLPAEASEVLELGCGTGNLTLRLLARFPRARVTTVDAAPEMTEVTEARARAAHVAERLTTVTARFEDVERLVAAGSMDLVVSSLSLHHVVDKAALYGKIRGAMKRGAGLVIADQLRGTTELTQQRHWDLWKKFCREPGHCTEEEIATLEAHAAAHDHYVALPEHFAMLGAAGFGELDMLWRNGMYSVISAVAV